MRATGTSSPEARISALIEPTVEGLGFVLVRVRLSGGRRPVLQVMAERRADGQMTVDDCTTLSRALSALLDVEDPIASEYLLEVSSPGLDRPLVKAEDFGRFAGHVARVETVRPLDGRRKFTGRLIGLSADGATVRIEVEGAAVDLPFADIAGAKLMLTDELIAASLKGVGLKGIGHKGSDGKQDA